MPLIKDELSRVVQEWNLHKMRPSSNELFPPGRPDTLYVLYFVSRVSDMDIEIARDTCCETPNTIVADTFSKLAEIIMADESLF